MADVTINGAALTVVGGLLSALAAVVAYLYKETVRLQNERNADCEKRVLAITTDRDFWRDVSVGRGSQRDRAVDATRQAINELRADVPGAIGTPGGGGS